MTRESGSTALNKAVFDKAVLLECLSGDEEGVLEVCQAFLETFPLELRELQRALNEKDIEALECKAHGIKGAAANLGSATLQQAALALETAAKAEDMALAKRHLQHLEYRFAELKTVLSQ